MKEKMKVSEWYENFALEVELEEGNFLKIKETLTRIGITSKKDKSIFQSCHILQKKGKFYIVHFLELFALDGKETSISKDDIIRRDSIIILLQKWGLLKVIDEPKLSEKSVFVRVIHFNDKENWNLVPKYSIGSDNKPRGEK